MSTFSADLKARMGSNKLQSAVMAPGTITLNPDDFKSEYSKRPQSPVVVGLRILSERDTQQTIDEATKKAAEANPESELKRAADFEKQALVEYVSRVLCSPNDVTEAAEGFDRAVYDVPAALNPVAIRRIYDAAEKLVYDSSPLMRQITDEEAAELAIELEAGSLALLDSVDSARGKRARKYLRLVLDELQSVQ